MFFTVETAVFVVLFFTVKHRNSFQTAFTWCFLVSYTAAFLLMKKKSEIWNKMLTLSVKPTVIIYFYRIIRKSYTVKFWQQLGEYGANNKLILKSWNTAAKLVFTV